MNDKFIDKYTSEDPTFKLIEKVPDKKNQNVMESKFTLGNGFIGSRGIYEENPSGCEPGTFIPGIFDRSGAQVEELVNLPNPFNFIIAVDGEKFDVFFMKVRSHYRALDMKKGTIVRKTEFEDAKGRKFLYRSVRFFSMDNPHIGAMKISLRLLKGKASLTGVDSIDDSVYNKGGLMMAKKRHFNIIKADKEDNSNYISFKTNSYNHIISYGDSLSVSFSGKRKKFLKDRICDFNLSANDEVTFTKIFCIKTSLDYSAKSLKRETMRDLNGAVKEGFDKIFKSHAGAFEKKWNLSDIFISGDRESQKAVRFCIYHMLIAAGKKYGRYSIGAKTLSGEGYRGHIFWDTEIYILPFFIYTQPEVAKELLMLRYNTLEEARKIARSKGYRGAMYPWESTASGTEQTPRYAKEIDGSIGEVWTQDYEHHIAADVAFGVSEYYKATGDREFILNYGAEIIFETARFWASRVIKKEGSYHINGVIGPDEFHVNVDDNAFTNYMASWNMKRACELWEDFKGEEALEKLKSRLKITEKEIDSWRCISSKIVVLYSKKYKIITQFKNYLKKKEIKIRSYDNFFMPEAPKYIEHVGLDKTRFIKQADVVLLFALFPDKFSIEARKRNYDFYLKRTLHKSSLSFSSHAVVGSEMGDRYRAFNFFWASANIDLFNLAGNTEDGIHAANLGGVWQSVVRGFAGLTFRDGVLEISPRLPNNFRTLKFKVYFKGDLYEMEISNKKVRLKCLAPEAKDRNPRKLRVFDKDAELIPFRYSIFKSVEVNNMICAKDIMKKGNMLTIHENVAVAEIGRILVENRASSAPVVDRNNILKGIVSEINIIEATSKENFSQLKASDIMKTDVVCANIDEPLEEITKTFTKFPYRRLPVLDGKKVVGLITRRDIIADFLGGFY
ncbi:MAG: CBS domain-containing protein [Elusimicrobiota bacterium]